MYQKYFNKTGNLNEFAVWAADFIDNLPVGMYRTTLEGELIFCNWTFASLLGYNTPSMLQDVKVVELFPHKEERGKFIRELLESGEVNNFDLEMVRRDGDVFSCSTSAKAVANEDGLVIYIDGVMTESGADVQQQNKEESFRESGEKGTIHLLLDSGGRILEQNEPGRKLLGEVLSLPDQLGSSLYDFVSPSSKQKLDDLLSGALDQEVVDDVFAVMTSQGEVRQLACQAFAMPTREGGDPGVRIVGKDVTNTLEGLKERQREEKLQGVLEMAGGIAHNMNQPLMIINNLLLDILNNIDDDYTVAQDKLERIRVQVEKLNSIAAKVRSVKQYKSMHYLLGEKIVDLENIT